MQLVNWSVGRSGVRDVRRSVGRFVGCLLS